MAVLIISAAAGAGWYYRDAGFLPQVEFTSKGGQAARRLIDQGDRALAAGQVFEPYEGSAMSFYQAAYGAKPGDLDAAHGLRIAGEQITVALEEAIAFDDVARVEELAKILARLPDQVFDPTETQTTLASARIRWAAADKQSERIDEFLQAAAADIDAGRLLGSGTDNALAKYRAVQILEPGNPDAEKGLQSLGVHLARRGQEALERDDTDGAAEWFEQAKMLNGQAPEVIALEGKLSNVRTTKQAVQDRQSEVGILLRSANEDIAANRLSSPAGRNALERYRRVLKLDPDNSQARRGIEQIHDRYIAQATEALRSDDLETARGSLAKARKAQPNSSQVVGLQEDIEGARERVDRAEAERLAAEAEAQIQAAKRIRDEAEMIRREAEQDRKRRQEAEAARLFAEAQRKAKEETQLIEGETQARHAAEAAVPRIVIDFYGFDPKYKRDFLSIEQVIEEVEPLIRNAGYTVVKRHDVHDNGRDWANVKVVIYRLIVNSNTATGLYSYVGSVNVFNKDALGMASRAALDTNPLWTRGYNGFGPPSELGRLVDYYGKMTKDFLKNLPGRRR